MTYVIDADLVVLSACETAVSAAGGHNDFAGLGYALLYAGARSALLTLWPVDIDTTRMLMSSFHRRRQEGTGSAEALRAAVLELRDCAADWRSWAPYILLG